VSVFNTFLDDKYIHQIRQFFVKKYNFMGEVDEMHYEYESCQMSKKDREYYESNFKTQGAFG